MADKKSTDSKSPKPSETARKIWLAGIGAYGKAFSEAQDALKGMTQDGSKAFESLVKKGETLEATVQEKRKEFVEKTKASTEDFGEEIDERIKQMRSRLNRNHDGQAEFDKRLEGLEAKLDRILAILEPDKSVRKPAAKKAAPKKPTAKKAPAKKPVKTATKSTKK